MAYAAVISLKHTIQRLPHSFNISLVPPSQNIIEFAYRQVQSLQEIFKKLDCSSKSSSRKRLNALDGEIREAVCKLEDVIESHVTNQIVKQSESHPLKFSIDLQDLEQEIDSFAKMVKKIKEEMKQEYIKELDNPFTVEDDDAVSPRPDFGGNKSKMVGLSDEYSELKEQLTSRWMIGIQVIPIVGMAGIGKTTLVKEIFEDLYISKYFYFRVSVTVGRKCQYKKIPRVILAQVKPDHTEKLLTTDDEKIAQYLKESLRGKSYLIVLDDVWDKKVWCYLKTVLPNNGNPGVVFLTTRLREVAEDANQSIVKMRLLNKEESWELLREKTFAEKLCPPQLEKAGKKIAENCDGLPLMISTVANLLTKAEMTPEYWSKVAAEKENSLFMDAYKEISEVQFPSYDNLPLYLKAFFLYMGVFPQNYETPLSELIKMWIAEGFLEPYIFQTLEDCAMTCLEELVSHSLVIVYQKSTIWSSKLTDGIKTCGLHSSLRYLCNREAGKNKFFHVLNSRVDGLAEAIKSQRRLCVHNNILFGIKDVYNSMEEDCASTARSLLCFGPYHQYPMPICFGLRLLRVLHALTIRFYEFPVEVLKLVQLRYLALTYNGKLNASISKLCNLQFLIICRHLSIKSCQAPLHLPMEIWDMKELKHLQIMGSDLPDPCGALLPNLLTLLDVSAHSCTKGVLERIPNLEKLGIRIELEPDATQLLCCFDHISHLAKLQSLKCVIMTPELRSGIDVGPHAPLSMLPLSLRKLSLSGLGYPWEYMSVMGSLPNLEVLKLRCYAFRGPKWEIGENRFQQLRFLLIEDTDLVQWQVGRGSFSRLTHLSIKHCYKLEELHFGFDNIIQKIEVVDCNPLAVTCLNQIKEAISRKSYYYVPNVYVHSSWNDGNLKS